MADFKDFVLPVKATQWYPGENEDLVQEIRHGTLGIIGQIKNTEKTLVVLPSQYIVQNPDGDYKIITEEAFKKYYIENTHWRNR